MSSLLYKGKIIHEEYAEKAEEIVSVINDFPVLAETLSNFSVEDRQDLILSIAKELQSQQDWF